jgi:hypothetical protein
MGMTDDEALQLCIDETLAEGGAARMQIEDKLASGEPWEDVGAFCSYSCQCRNLRLPPWLPTPSRVDEDLGHAPGWSATDPATVALLKRMLAAGISRYHPDPLKALAEADIDAAITSRARLS